LRNQKSQGMVWNQKVNWNLAHFWGKRLSTRNLQTMIIAANQVKALIKTKIILNLLIIESLIQIKQSINLIRAVPHPRNPWKRSYRLAKAFSASKSQRNPMIALKVKIHASRMNRVKLHSAKLPSLKILNW
jgi:hypothetical protein